MKGVFVKRLIDKGVFHVLENATAGSISSGNFVDFLHSAVQSQKAFSYLHYLSSSTDYTVKKFVI